MIAWLEVPEELVYETICKVVEPAGGEVIFSYTRATSSHRVLKINFPLHPRTYRGSQASKQATG